MVREGIPLDLLFTNRDGLMGDVWVRSCLGQQTGILLLRSGEGSAKLLPWFSEGQNLNYSDTCKEGPERKRCPGILGSSQGGSLKDIGAGCPRMP